MAIAHGSADAIDAVALVLDDRLWLVHHDARATTLTTLARHAIAFRRQLVGHHPDATLETILLDDDLVAAEVLGALGFAPEHEFADVLALELDDTNRERGVGVELSPAADLPASDWLALHASVFAAMPLDEPRLEALRSRPTYDAALDVVIRNPDGTPVAFAIAWLCPVSGDVWVEPLGTGPAHRGAGWAQKLVAALCARCAEHGARRVLLAIEPHNAIARRIYERAGFVRIAQQTMWRAWV